MVVQSRHPLGDIEDFLDGRGCLAPVGTLAVSTGQCTHHSPGRVADRNTGRYECAVWVLDALECRTIQRSAERLGGLQQLERLIVFDKGQRAASHAFDHLRAQFSGRGTRDARDQLVRLVDDHGAVLGKCSPTVQGVDCQ